MAAPVLAQRAAHAVRAVCAVRAVRLQGRVLCALCCGRAGLQGEQRLLRPRVLCVRAVMM